MCLFQIEKSGAEDVNPNYNQEIARLEKRLKSASTANSELDRDLQQEKLKNMELTHDIENLGETQRSLESGLRTAKRSVRLDSKKVFDSVIKICFDMFDMF